MGVSVDQCYSKYGLQTGARLHCLLLIPDEVRTEIESKCFETSRRNWQSAVLFLESNEKLRLIFYRSLSYFFILIFLIIHYILPND